MHGTLPKRVEEQRQIERQLRQGHDKIVRRNFGVIAKALWPLKTAAHVAAISKVDERTASRWIAGEFPPSATMVLEIMRLIIEE